MQLLALPAVALYCAISLGVGTRLLLLARKTGGGAMLLAVFYVTLVLLAWVSIMLVLLGLVEQIVGLRRRMNSEDKA